MVKQMNNYDYDFYFNSENTLIIIEWTKCALNGEHNYCLMKHSRE